VHVRIPDPADVAQDGREMKLSDFLAGLLFDLTAQGMLWLFSVFDSPAGKKPFAGTRWPSAHQHDALPAIQDHRVRSHALSSVPRHSRQASRYTPAVTSNRAQRWWAA